MDGGIFRPVSSRKILSMGVSTLAVRRNIHHFGGNHTPRSRAASLNVLKFGRVFLGGDFTAEVSVGFDNLALLRLDCVQCTLN